MIEVKVDIHIKANAGELFRFIANPENNPKWQGGMKKCELTNGAELRVGSEYKQEAEFMGKPILTTFRITEFEADHLIKGESIVSTFPITFKRIVESDANQAKVSAIVTGDPSGFLRIFPFLTRWMIRSSIKKDYKRLKQIFEQNT